MPRHVKTVVAIRRYQPHRAGKGIECPEFRGVAISSAIFSSKVTSSSGIWSLLLLLVACGGGGGGGSSSKPVVGGNPQKPPQKPTPPETDQSEASSQVSGSLYDPPIAGARVYIDVNRNNQADLGDILIDAETDSEGNYYGEIPVQYQGFPLVSNNKNTIHIVNGREILNDPNLPHFFVAPAGSKVISPLTHVIHVIEDFGLANIREYKLFTGFKPLMDNVYAAGADFVYQDYIKAFLADLCLLIKRYADDYNMLGNKLRALLAEYAKILAEPEPTVPEPGEVIKSIDKENPAPPEAPDAPEAPRLVVTEDIDYRLMETPSSKEMATGVTVSASDPNPGETVSFDVTDDRFEVRKDGKLGVKAGQKFDYEREPAVTLTITATDSSTKKLKHSKQVTVHIGNDLTEKPFADVKVPVETVPTIRGNKLETHVITTEWRKADGNIGLERTGHWNVYNQDGGNQLTLKIGFGGGDEIVVARLVRDDKRSFYKWDTSEDAPTLTKKFAGKYGYFQITNLGAWINAKHDSVGMIKWKYVLFSESGTGAPVNRLKPGEEATEKINFITQNDASETESDEKSITFKVHGKDERLFILKRDSEAKTLADEFPVKKPSDDEIQNWSWWKEGNIIQHDNNKGAVLKSFTVVIGKDAQITKEDGLIWRFVPVDVDVDYGDIDTFVKTYIKFKTVSDTMSSTHKYFEVVQAKDASGNPRFITMPDGKDRLPVLDLRLKSDAPFPSDYKKHEEQFEIVLIYAKEQPPHIKFVKQVFYVPITYIKVMDKDGAGDSTTTFSYDFNLIDWSSLTFVSRRGGWKNVESNSNYFTLNIDIDGGKIYAADGTLVKEIAQVNGYQLLNSSHGELGDLSEGNHTYNLVYDSATANPMRPFKALKSYVQLSETQYFLGSFTLKRDTKKTTDWRDDKFTIVKHEITGSSTDENRETLSLAPQSGENKGNRDNQDLTSNQYDLLGGLDENIISETVVEFV